ncbi:acyltransferase-domain-containing protein [Testicularia cyperi]|uniref:Acyltransferase-domain-containing protein n=1 Tax=Testicularia cyperi TaxID=1882483 RepID=A0A317XI21_9BASI|nr:acyltransferase-domain-containing protein [Testicularia cyperi]
MASTAQADPVSAKTGLGTHVGVPPHSIPISSRPPKSTRVQTVLFALVFNFCIVSTNFFQILSWPLSLHPATLPLYTSIIGYTKLAFARALLVISQFFGPTQLVISIGDGQGGYLDPEQFVRRNKRTGAIEAVELPKRSVWMSNHQVYTDWLYLWCLAYYADTADSILIILKNSLKWIPIVGWGMQFFRFIFLARNWASDQAPLAKHLGAIASDNHSSAAASNNANSSGNGNSTKPSNSTAKKLLLLIFPEGTLVSPNTRPISAKFADKMGIKDMENVLLPRSTGLHFCLRTLAKEMDDLWLVDFTVGYPGVPPAGYGQDFYTLRSIFMQGVPPPAIHIHYTLTRITPPVGNDSSSNASSVAHVSSASIDTPPLGDLSASDHGPQDPSLSPSPSPSESEKKHFEQWLFRRWRAKDQLMHRFYTQGDFVNGKFTQTVAAGAKIDPCRPTNEVFVVLPAQLRSIKEVGDAACWGVPFIVANYAWKMYRAVF